MHTEQLQHDQDGFELRGLAFSRLDAFSDVVFGFALTLLVVSLEVPKTYAELRETLNGFVPFALCFTLLMLVWYAHYKFFRRFHLHDRVTVVINSILLFVVLFYVYPLKFLFTFVVSASTGHSLGYVANDHQVGSLMVLFGLGFASVYLLVGALYLNARRYQHQLNLTPIELFLTHTYIVESGVVASIGLLSCLITWGLTRHDSRYVGLAGLTFLLIGPFKRLYGNRTRRRVAAMRAADSLASVTLPPAQISSNPAKAKPAAGSSQPSC